MKLINREISADRLYEQMILKCASGFTNLFLVLEHKYQRPERYVYSYELTAAIITAYWTTFNLIDCRYKINVGTLIGIKTGANRYYGALFRHE